MLSRLKDLIIETSTPHIYHCVAMTYVRVHTDLIAQKDQEA